SGVMKGAGDLANGHAVAVREANLGIVVHRQHPCLRCNSPVSNGSYCNECGWGGSILLADLSPEGGSLLRADYQRKRNETGKEDGEGSRELSRGVQGRTPRQTVDKTCHIPLWTR